MKTIAVLGSTGSIGTQTLDVVREHGDIRVGALGAGSNIDLLEKQIREFRPGLAAVWEEEKARELKSRVRDTNTKIVSGMDGLLELAVLPEAELAGDGHCGNDRDPPHHGGPGGRQGYCPWPTRRLW